ncbi:glycosyltransferase [Enterococcus massiliensis]|uniref:glycosyltransferase n=1 Tax=Enterococcus massiliensis TaxID=1640685 RepID=UPI00065E0BD7|nr:glycosyltransferase [Enterococcus massiliensis]
MVDVKGVIKNISKNYTDVQFYRRINYTKYYLKSRVRDNYILYESFHGKAMNDNPFAIFKYLIDSKEYDHFVHIWVLEDTEENEYVKYYSKFKNVKFIQPHTKEYFYYLCVAKYLIHNVTLPPYFIKKEEQIYVNTWHGTPLKTLGKEMLGSVSQNYNVQRNFLQADYILSPNQFTTDKLIFSYQVDGIFNGKVLENGYPRIDSIYSESQIVKNYLNSKGVDLEKKVILYAPTWRGQTGSVQNTFEDLMSRIRKIVSKIDKNQNELLVKVHPLVFQFVEKFDIDNVTFISDWVDANELLYFTDLLITDYSSIFFDYLVTDKPIIFFMYDKDEYQEVRGVYFDLESLPGEVCLDEDSVSYYINNSDLVLEKNKTEICNFKNEYVPYDTGVVTKDYVEYIFNNKKSVLKDISFNNGRENIILYGGALLNNGITSSIINLSKNLDYEKYNLIVIDKNAKNKQFDDNVAKISKKAHVLYRGGGIDLTYSEWIKYNKLFNRSLVSNIDDHRIFVQREWKRLLGKTSVDIAIDFGGYAPFWTYMMAFSNARKKIVYQHNDMKKESEKIVSGRYVHKKNLSTIFQLYKYFDSIASVGKLTKEQNEVNLTEYVPKEKFTYIPNLLDKDYLFSHRSNPQLFLGNILDEKKLIIDMHEECGKIEMAGIKIPQKNEKNFITIGRLSPEKDQEKLIKAFKQIIDETKIQYQLYIVGSGEDELKLKALVKGLKLEENIIFVGQTNKAMELLDLCDCFIFPSNHEGQPMTLLECLALEKPIVATDIPGNRSVLGDTKGLVVENSIEGLKKGIIAYLEGKDISSGLDVDEYNQEALKKLYTILN